jgi:hypothetical protein
MNFRIPTAKISPTKRKTTTFAIDFTPEDFFFGLLIQMILTPFRQFGCGSRFEFASTHFFFVPLCLGG